MRHQALLPFVSRAEPGATAPPWRRLALTPGAAGRPRIAARAPKVLTRLTLGAALLLVLLAGGLLLLRSAHADRVYPAIYVANVPLGGMTRGEAHSALLAQADEVHATEVIFRHDDQEWRTTLRELGLTVGVDATLDKAYEIGREDGAWDRLQTMARLVREDERMPLALHLNQTALDRWYDTIDDELGMPAREASLAIEGTTVTIVPEQDGTRVDRASATTEIVASLRQLAPLSAGLPTVVTPAAVTGADVADARTTLTTALSKSVGVTLDETTWTLAAADLGQFVTQRVDPEQRGAEAFSLGLDTKALASWLETKLAAEINRDPVDAIVGWNGERLVSLEWSVDGRGLESAPLAEQVEASFFGDHQRVPVPVTITKPTIDSENLGRLGVTTLLGTGSSNYSGSTVGRATNVEVGAALLNGTLVPPRGEFSFNFGVGVINEERGFVEAQVIDGERIGKDIGGGICQVSTTVFRAAYLAGMPISEWWPHRYRIPFYEYDGWAMGLDASILQPTEDPATWGDFRFENPSDSWMLVESWSDGVNVVVNLYGEDLGYEVSTVGPELGPKIQILPDIEVVDNKLDPGSFVMGERAQEGQEVSHFRQVLDRNGNLLWERNFWTKYYARGNVWKVSPDMVGKSPADPKRKLPPPSDQVPTGVEGGAPTSGGV